MPRQVVVRVEAGGDSDLGPYYALVEVEAEGVGGIRQRLADTIQLAERYRVASTTPIRIGPVYGVEFWLGDFPIRVTWLQYAALIDPDGGEPEWVAELDQCECYAVVERFAPDLGEPDAYGRSENQLTAVEIETVVLRPDGTFTIEAVIDGTSISIGTVEVPVSVLIGEEA